MFQLGYNTNGLIHHRLGDAFRMLAELGYDGVALTPDVGHLDPFEAGPAEIARVREQAEDLGLSLTVETGARFLLDPRRKHSPSLLELDARDRARRLDLLLRCVALASELGAGVVSFWAGQAPGGERADGRRGPSGEVEPIWDRLCEGVARVLAEGRAAGLSVAIEPEPGMFIERPEGYLELRRRLGSEGAELGLCLDVGHLLCTGDLPVDARIRELAPYLRQVHLDDIRGRVHEHLPFGEGDLDLAGTVSSLLEVGYGGMAAIELSRDSHRGASAAEEALRRVREAAGRAQPGPPGA